MAQLVSQGLDMWLDGCRQLAQDLADEGRLAQPWTPDEALDLDSSFLPVKG